MPAGWQLCGALLYGPALSGTMFPHHAAAKAGRRAVSVSVKSSRKPAAGFSSWAVLRCADVLRRVAGEHPSVAIGSYPNVAECAAKQAFRVKLQLESHDAEALERAVAAVREAIECFEPAMP